MSKKIKTGRFRVADFMNNLLVLPTMDTKKEGDMDITPIKEFIKQNEKDLELLGSYFKDMASSYAAGQTMLKPPEDIETKTNNLSIQFQQVIKQNYPAIFEKPSYYTGITAYYKSDGIAQFFQKETGISKEKPDYNDYFGHCIAFGKHFTGIICFAIRWKLNIGWIITKWLLEIHEFIPDWIKNTILYLLGWIIEKIKDELEPYKDNETGMIMFYFDRVDSFLRIHDKLDPKLQPPEKWHPKDYYPQTDWIKEWSLNI